MRDATMGSRKIAAVPHGESLRARRLAGAAHRVHEHEQFLSNAHRARQAGEGPHIQADRHARVHRREPAGDYRRDRR